MASLASFSCTCVLALAFFVLCLPLHADDQKLDRIHIESHLMVDVKAIFPSEGCSSSEEPSDTRMKLVHQYGPCSPFSGHQRTNHTQILQRDQFRVDWINQRHTTPRTKGLEGSSMIPVTTGDTLNVGNYVVRIGFGTPTAEMYVIMDTGSDVTWIQCKPCISCYTQQDPIFDPSTSSTYANISCKSDYCSQLHSVACSGSTCIYSVVYLDKSSTTGFFANDTLTLSSSDVLQNFRFGCGEKNQGLFGQAAGFLGLGRGPASMVSQSMNIYNGVFSYCLPSSSSSTGYLQFGSTPSSNILYTPLLTVPTFPSFYFLSLTGIVINGNLLPIPPTVFSTAGTIIDSGTVITRLPPIAYSALRSVFRQAMQNYPQAPADSLLDTCYDLSSFTTVLVPTITLQFNGGLSLNLDTTGILYILKPSQSCLAFAGNSAATDLGIIGNTQQRKFNVVYDIPNKQVGFGGGGCN